MQRRGQKDRTGTAVADDVAGVGHRAPVQRQAPAPDAAVQAVAERDERGDLVIEPCAPTLGDARPVRPRRRSSGGQRVGRGGAQARIESTLGDAEGQTDVSIITDLTLQGSVAQYGRGIVADVSSQLTKQFAECLASKLTTPAEAAAFVPSERPKSSRRQGSTRRLSAGAASE